MTLIKEKKMIDPRDFGLPGSPQSEECRLWACWLWVREKVEEDHDFIYRIYILRFFWIVGEIWIQLDFYIVSIIINSKNGL